MNIKKGVAFYSHTLFYIIFQERKSARRPAGFEIRR